jgi:hypothetical protein
MIIDSNLAAIRVLEPLALELAALQRESATLQYRLDKRSLSALRGCGESLSLSFHVFRVLFPVL